VLAAELAGREIEGTGGPGEPGPELAWSGPRELERVVLVDQRPLGKSPRSTPATYTKIWDEIRGVFARTRSARAKGFGPRRFSFNTDPGRCTECGGRGHVTVEMQFLPDLVVRCPECEGRRFNAETLRVKYRGKSVADVLAMSAGEALEFFENFPRVVSPLQTLVDVGLGYMVLGQPTATLSGGEAQRVRLSAELGRRRRGHGTGRRRQCCWYAPMWADNAVAQQMGRRTAHRGGRAHRHRGRMNIIVACMLIISLGSCNGRRFFGTARSGSRARLHRVRLTHILRQLQLSSLLMPLGVFNEQLLDQPLL